MTIQIGATDDLGRGRKIGTAGEIAIEGATVLEVRSGEVVVAGTEETTTAQEDGPGQEARRGTTAGGRPRHHLVLGVLMRDTVADHPLQ